MCTLGGVYLLCRFMTGITILKCYSVYVPVSPQEETSA